MYNLLVMPVDDPAYWQRNESLWIQPSWSQKRLPDRTDWEALRLLHCLFTYELKKPVVVGHIGKIVDMQFPQIRYQLEDRIEINRNCLRDLGFEPGDEHRTQWTVKDVDLYEIVTKWRRQEDNGRPSPTEAEMRRVWGDDYLFKPRVFLSHRASYRRNVSQVSDLLERAGYTCFVAHEDIHPGTKWHDEIIHTLDTMDVFVGFITEDFHAGGWPDQEVGYACQRGIPKVFLKLGPFDPRGMVSGEQALTVTWDDAGAKLMEHLRTEDVIPSYPRRERRTTGRHLLEEQTEHWAREPESYPSTSIDDLPF